MRIPISSIGDAAKKLRAIQRNWALYSFASHRRAALISEKLPKVSAKPIVFGAGAPKAPLGSWTLIDADTILVSPHCSSPFPNGEVLGAFCAVLARARKPYRLVGSEELARVAGTILHGGVVALAQPRPISGFDPAEAAEWACDGRLLLLLDGVGNPHNFGAIARTAAFFGLPRIVLPDHPAQALPSDASYRVAEGGLECVELYRGARFVQALRKLRHSHLVVGATAEGGRPIGTPRRI
jgi:tRNA G18 (ribose-2'-O)-methylase SpoU